jgi:hypothetical protein
MKSLSNKNEVELDEALDSDDNISPEKYDKIKTYLDGLKKEEKLGKDKKVNLMRS